MARTDGHVPTVPVRLMPYEWLTLRFLLDEQRKAVLAQLDRDGNVEKAQRALGEIDPLLDVIRDAGARAVTERKRMIEEALLRG